MAPAHRAKWIALVRRIVAATCAVVVFGLGVFAASPTLHERVHSRMAVGPDHHCAVEIFANGISVPLGIEPIAAPNSIGLAEPPAPAIEICLSSPRFLLQPERGPPAA